MNYKEMEQKYNTIRLNVSNGEFPSYIFQYTGTDNKLERLKQTIELYIEYPTFETFYNFLIKSKEKNNSLEGVTVLYRSGIASSLQEAKQLFETKIIKNFKGWI